MLGIVSVVLAVLLGVVATVGVLWLKTRPVRNGTLAQAWGLPEDDEARAEIESIFPGATRPCDEGLPATEPQARAR